jgi:hypothetical protein
LTSTIRSKNAGPFTLTIDLVFDARDSLDRVLGAASFTTAAIADLYGVPEPAVRICPFERVNTIKVSMPRPDAGSGAPGDRDVYGCQQHFPLGNIEI